MGDMNRVEERFVSALRRALADCPAVSDRFYDSFEFTTTGNNLAHPRTLGLIVKVCWEFPQVAAVDIDRRFNLGSNAKFQPDVTAVAEDGSPLLFVDYESPNSSDARIPTKDVKAFCQWRERSGTLVSYFIITSLPTKASDWWELRYTSPGYYNAGHKTHRDAIMRNPKAYWYSHYRYAIDQATLAEYPIRFLNQGAGVRRP